MKHYPHHIGDFDKATRHLTRIERSVYRDLIDLYYDTEERLTLDMPALCRKIIARSDEEVTAVQQVLNEFFTKTETGYWHERCEGEIESYRAHCSQKALAGKASAAKKAAAKERAINGKPTAVQQPLNSVATAGNGEPTNHKPLTKNHIEEPIGSSSASASRPARKPVDKSKVDDDKPGSTVWAAYALAYTERYKQQPVRNAKVNAHCRQLVERIGADDAPRLAGWYVRSENLPFYVSRSHPLDALVRDCEGMLTRMRNGQAMTRREAAQADDDAGRVIDHRRAAQVAAAIAGDEPLTLTQSGVRALARQEAVL